MDRLFVLQKSYIEDKYNPDGANILFLMKAYSRRHLDEYVIESDECFSDCNNQNIINTTFRNAEKQNKKIIPVGTLEFVLEGLKYTSKNPDIHMKPIEIPEIFRHRRFLMRDYNIKLGKDIPEDILKNGKDWFIKDATTLKYWNNLLIDGDCSKYIDPNKKYAVSNRINILSEYRVFVCKGKVVGIMNYSGDPLLLPDTDYIRMINDMYQTIEHPGSYTLDLAVMEFGSGQRGTTLLEIHPFVSCGLYGFYDESVLDMLDDGITWYIQKNSERRKNELEQC